MAMPMGNGDKHPVMSEINVTPLVDVVLVLLIIFMITTPLLEQGIPVDLPQTKTTALKPSEKQIVLEITNNKDIFLGKQKLSLKTLEINLAKVMKQRRQREVFVRADRRVPYGFVAQIMASIKAVGITRVGLVTEPLP